MTFSRSEIFVAYGDSPSEMVRTLLEKIDPPANADPALRIGIKPNLVVAKPAKSGATTSPEVVESLIGYLHSRGLHDICVMESSWVGEDTDRAFDACGYRELARRTGVKLVNLERAPAKEVQAGGVSLRVCTDVLDVDYLINVPVLKAHCQTKMTCALKNLKGCIPDSEKRRFHRLGLHEPIARLNTVLKSDLIIVDVVRRPDIRRGRQSCADGPDYSWRRSSLGRQLLCSSDRTGTFGCRAYTHSTRTWSRRH